MSENLVQLPNGDLWRPPVRDENGNNVERRDTLELGALPVRPMMSPDVAAILMRDYAQLQAAAIAKPAE